MAKVKMIGGRKATYTPARRPKGVIPYPIVKQAWRIG